MSKRTFPLNYVYEESLLLLSVVITYPMCKLNETSSFVCTDIKSIPQSFEPFVSTLKILHNKI